MNLVYIIWAFDPTFDQWLEIDRMHKLVFIIPASGPTFGSADLIK